MGDQIGCPVIEWQMLVKNPEAAASFYGGLFGWTVDSNNALGYWRIATGAAGGINGGIWPSPPEGHNLVQLFIGVESVPDYHVAPSNWGRRRSCRRRSFPMATSSRSCSTHRACRSG